MEAKHGMRNWIIFAACFLSLEVSAQNEGLVFKYGPADYVASCQAFRLTASEFVTGQTYNRPFSDKLSLTRLPGTLYGGPVLFGGWQTVGTLEPVNVVCSVYNDGEKDPLFFRFKNSGREKAAAAVLLCGRPAEPVKFSEIKEFLFSAKRNGLSSGSQARAMIKAGNRFYLSSRSLNIPEDYPVRPQVIKVDEWLEYDPLISIGQIGGVSSPGPQAEDEVELVGFHFQHIMPGESAVERSLFIREFEVRGAGEGEQHD